MPLFVLQLRIIKLTCQSGYNLDKNENDFVDYLILSALNLSEEQLFVSNETRMLIPFLKENGFQANVISLTDYLTAIGFNQTL
ncbi:MAG: hypothetical protein IPH18_08480 [Chitinophagaceae bacterium]|nr:hypothetical protein [Chitinophagaceae bacterium]